MKNAKKYLRLLWIAGMIAILSMPPQAYAGDGLPPSFDSCANSGATALNQPQPGDSSLTAKVVYCVQYTIEQAVSNMLVPLSNYMVPTVGVLFTFALVLFGIQVIAENNRNLTNRTFGMISEPNKKKGADTMALLIRAGIVAVFSYNLGGFANSVFSIEQQMLTLVSGGYSPWTQMDYFLGTLIGFAPGLVLFQGLLGILVGAAFSTTAGIGVFFAGIMALLEVMLLIFDAVYTYLMAMLVIGFQLILSAFIIPLGIFSYTSERYVWKWLNMLLSAMLVPIVMFAALSLFLGIFNLLIANILMTLGSTCTNPTNLATCSTPDFHSYWQDDVPVQTMLMPNDPNYIGELQAVDPTGVNLPAIQPASNPFLMTAISAMPVTMPGIGFGNAANTWKVMTQLIFSFAALWIFASIMKSFVNKTPEIAQDIAKAASGVSMQESPLSKPAKSIMQMIKSQAGGAT